MKYYEHLASYEQKKMISECLLNENTFNKLLKLLNTSSIMIKLDRETEFPLLTSSELIELVKHIKEEKEALKR